MAHDPMDEKYWKAQIKKSIKMIGKDKLITSTEEEKLLKKLKDI